METHHWHPGKNENFPQMFVVLCQGRRNSMSVTKQPSPASVGYVYKCEEVKDITFQ